jgi:hypothetical protein
MKELRYEGHETAEDERGASRPTQIPDCRTPERAPELLVRKETAGGRCGPEGHVVAPRIRCQMPIGEAEARARDGGKPAPLRLVFVVLAVVSRARA